MFSVPLYFQVTQKVSNSEAGAHLFPSVFGNALGGVFCGYFIKRYVTRLRSEAVLTINDAELESTSGLFTFQQYRPLSVMCYCSPDGTVTQIGSSHSIYYQGMFSGFDCTAPLFCKRLDLTLV
jgi:hypothetical protein